LPGPFSGKELYEEHVFNRKVNHFRRKGVFTTGTGSGANADMPFFIAVKIFYCMVKQIFRKGPVEERGETNTFKILKLITKILKF
jgi:hypothetical protein